MKKKPGSSTDNRKTKLNPKLYAAFNVPGPGLTIHITKKRNDIEAKKYAKNFLI